MGHDADRGREATIRNIVYSKLSAFELSVTRSIIWSIQTVPRRLKRQAPFIVLRKYYRMLVFDVIIISCRIRYFLNCRSQWRTFDSFVEGFSPSSTV